MHLKIYGVCVLRGLFEMTAEILLDDGRARAYTLPDRGRNENETWFLRIQTRSMLTR